MYLSNAIASGIVVLCVEFIDGVEGVGRYKTGISENAFGFCGGSIVIWCIIVKNSGTFVLPIGWITHTKKSNEKKPWILIAKLEVYLLQCKS